MEQRKKPLPACHSTHGKISGSGRRRAGYRRYRMPTQRVIPVWTASLACGLYMTR